MEKIQYAIYSESDIFAHPLKKMFLVEGRCAEGLNFCFKAKDPATLLQTIQNNKDRIEVLLVVFPFFSIASKNLITRIRAMHPALKILIYPFCGNEEETFALIVEGANGMLKWSCSPAELIDGIFSIQAAEYLQNDCLTSFNIHVLKKMKAAPAVSEKPLLEIDIAILKLLVEGYKHGRIAKKLNMEKRTLEDHFVKLRQRFHCRNSPQLAAMAKEILEKYGMV